MKSKHRHELETNWLATKLGEFIEDVRPYSSTIFGAVVVAIVAFVALSYFTGATSARQSEAWSSYNEAVEGVIPNLEELRLAAEQHAGSEMQRWADMTWADGHVWMAARDYLFNHATATENLNRAAGTYRKLLEDATDAQIESRAHFGLGRVYEMRGELDKAREEYLSVRGGFQELAEVRAKALEETKTKEAYDWLVSAQASRQQTPTGPGTPGQRPDFSVGGIDFPSTTGGDDAGATDGGAATVDDLFSGFDLPDEPDDRYEAEGGSGDIGGATDEAPAASDETESNTGSAGDSSATSESKEP